MSQHPVNEKRWIYFDEGDLRDICLYTTDYYAQFYPGGNTDPEMMASIKVNDATGKVIFDIGAFIGASSLVFSKLVGENGRVVAFEPNPYNSIRLEKILQKNKKYSKNILVYPYALSDSNKKLQLHLSEAIDTGHSSTSRIEGSHSTIHDSDLPDGFKNVEVEAMTLDSFVAKEKINPDILKVDIEGAEYEFLLGAVETIRKVHPTFYIEFHSPFCATKCTELLVLEGYSVQVIHEEEDNRVMILAEYISSKPSSGADVERMKAINNSFSILKDMSGSLASLNAELQIKASQNRELLEQNNALKTEKKIINELESTNQALASEIKALEASLSWKLTKPLRKTKATISRINQSTHDDK